jgi:hypothetical protein
MATTYTLISSVSLSSAAANITFSSIPATYTDLIVKFSTKEATTGAWEIFVDFNNTTSNQTCRVLRGSGGYGVSSATTSNIKAAGNVGVTPFSNAEMYIPNYASSNYKSVSIDSVSEYGAAESYQILTAGLWSDTAAITSIKLRLASGNIAQYSTAYLYGISNA